MLRNLGPAGPATGALVDDYCVVFAACGQAVDPAAVRRSLEAHFAARYRDLRFHSARQAPTYRTALGLSRALVAGAGDGLSSGGGDPI